MDELITLTWSLHAVYMYLVYMYKNITLFPIYMYNYYVSIENKI